jgi:uncharacterized membrane protein HdeD (DUF308 family)
VPPHRASAVSRALITATAGTRALFILGGLVPIVFGAVLFGRPDIGAYSLALLFGFFSLSYGIAQISMGTQLRSRLS